jgi:phosphohistidine swiveling domain-containing protein
MIAGIRGLDVIGVLQYDFEMIAREDISLESVWATISLERDVPLIVRANVLTWTIYAFMSISNRM